MTKAELYEQIDSMTDEEAAQVKLIFAPDWPSKATSIEEIRKRTGTSPMTPRGIRPALRIAAHRRRGIGVRERGRGSALEVRVVDEVLAEDLARCTSAARLAIEPTLVLSGDEEATKPALVLVAVGERHPARPWKPSVYEIAHRRINS